jgi:hypothetical protein
MEHDIKKAIKKFIDEHDLPITEGGELYQDICDALEWEKWDSEEEDAYMLDFWEHCGLDRDVSKH